MSVATNWFTESQLGRLKRAGLDHYFDNVVGADAGFNVELNAGWNTLQLIRRGSDGSWICIDYAMVTLVA